MMVTCCNFSTLNFVGRDSWMFLPQWGLIAPSLDGFFSCLVHVLFFDIDGLEHLRSTFSIRYHSLYFAIHSEFGAPCHSPCPCGFRICTIRKYSPEVTSGATVCKSKTEYLRDCANASNQGRATPTMYNCILIIPHLLPLYLFRRLQQFWNIDEYW